MAGQLRLDKFLADAGIGTRSEVKQLLRKGLVTVNSEIEKRPEVKVDSSSDVVCYLGKQLSGARLSYYMLNKPQGVLSATEDREQKTVLDLFPQTLRKKLFPVGRLDKDTEGLLLLTDDGELAHQLLSPKRHVPKVYYAKIRGHLGETEVERVAKGIRINDEFTAMPARLELLGDLDEEHSHIRLTIEEGKYHQVKRMMHACGAEVVYLKRLQMGSLRLDENLKLGEFRELTKEELEQLL